MAAKPEGRKNKKDTKEIPFRSEVTLLAILAVCILLFISNFGFGGFIGEKVSLLLFGLFGMMAYLVPVCFFVGAAFFISNRENGLAMIKLIAGILFVSFLCLFVELIVGGDTGYSIKKSFQYAVKYKSGGGALGGMIVSILCPAIGKAGAYVVDVITLIISMVILTERSFLGGVKKGSRKVYDSAKEDAARRKEVRQKRRERQEFRRERQVQRRIDKKVEGVALDTKIYPIDAKLSDNISELKMPVEKERQREKEPENAKMKDDFFSNIDQQSVQDVPEQPEPMVVEKLHRKPSKSGKSDRKTEPELAVQTREAPTFSKEEIQETSNEMNARKESDSMEEIFQEVSGSMSHLVQEEMGGTKKERADYVLPPVSLLKPGNPGKRDNRQQLQETALQLQQILKNFGVNVTISDVSCGPSVTRYELQPELGVKVSKIVNLADDIKLNLAAADIRIEAPIPGKAAVGIEVPNKENVMVRFREMIEAKEFQNHPSSICFTAGKDIGGQVVVADIAKMPHLLIAGATGSGKSVCINTIIMSILYKANPEDVKLILIDPKVVELSVYNGIPHLFIPVVTDPKKAAGALHWAVAEMTDRYQKFADYQVRDLKGYNQKVEAIKDVEDDTKPGKLPQIVIVVDELADLMMVAPGDVEDAICRLAQLARAAGIHLIIATQRPSVDVITGLIKANMPSRIAFSVSSGVDSRTILDMNGAEKLLGNGDMLFYPQGYQKPLRVQGPFVSDLEVEKVVEFLKKQSTVVYNEEIEEKMNTVTISSGGTGAVGGSERDTHFVEAGKFVIEKEKGSIGMLQRMFKIGFNRAARIMDQLEEAGVVGPEEGTKARKILMTLSEFEEYVDEHV